MYDNRIKIKSNPYTRKTEYTYLDEKGEWIPVTSRLASDAFTNITIQHRAYEILDEINRVYNRGNKGIDLIFEGTDDDYSDICARIAADFSDSKINCIRGDLGLACAREVMPAIEDIYKELRATFHEYPEDEIWAELEKFYETMKPVIPICVVGLYSSGKSAFINSLIGEEILPSASEPTTAKNYEIVPDETACICFTYDGTEVTLRFEGDRYTADCAADLEILHELQRAIDENPIHSQSRHMYRALQIINEYDKHQPKDHLSTLVEIHVPFRGSRLPLDRFDFLIYDTPGSDSVHKRHLSVLKESLKGQTNGLPVFITTPDEMDKEKNNEIIRLIEEIGEGLDQTNTMVIVNKADEKDGSVLEGIRKKGGEFRITGWKSSRVYFVSSILALGSKKPDPMKRESWMDRQYFKEFRQKASCFSDPQDEFYLPLGQYNSLPGAEREEMWTEEELIYQNSGLACVEEAISDFAYKSALYHKCAQAGKYLDRAIALAACEAQRAEEYGRKVEAQAEKELNERERELLEELKKKSLELERKFKAEYSNGIDWLVFNKCNPHGVWSDIQSCVKNYLDKKVSWSERQYVERMVNFNLSRARREVQTALDDWSVKYWAGACQRYKDICSETVAGSELPPEQKEALKDYVMNVVTADCSLAELDLEKENVIRDRKLFGLFHIGKKLDEGACREKIRKHIDSSVREMKGKLMKENMEIFREWSTGFDSGLKARLSAFNPSLSELSEDLEACRRESRYLTGQRRILGKKKEELAALMEFEVRSES